MRRKTFTYVKDGSKKRKLAGPSTSAKLYADDYKAVCQMMRDQEKPESEIIREIVSDWFRKKRVEEYGQNDSEDSVRKMYERVLDERLKPLAEAVSQLKSAVTDRPSTFVPARDSVNQPQLRPENGDILSTLTAVREMLERTGYELSESASSQMSLLDEIHRSQQALQGIGCETYASSWTIMDLIVRYLVEVSLLKDNSDTIEVETEVVRDRIGLRIEGLKKIAAVEALFDLPKAFQLAERFLPQNFKPINPAEMVNKAI